MAGVSKGALSSRNEVGNEMMVRIADTIDDVLGVALRG